MKVLAAALVLLIVLGLVWALIVLSQQVARQWRSRHSEWESLEQSQDEYITIYAVRPGYSRQLVGSVPFNSKDFDIQLDELRVEAELKVDTLNRRLNG